MDVALWTSAEVVNGRADHLSISGAHDDILHLTGSSGSKLVTASEAVGLISDGNNHGPHFGSCLKVWEGMMI